MIEGEAEFTRAATAETVGEIFVPIVMF